MLSYFSSIVVVTTSAFVCCFDEDLAVIPPPQVSTVAECLTSNAITPEEMSRIATFFNVQSYLVVEKPGLQLVLDSGDLFVLSNTVLADGSVKLFGQLLSNQDEVRKGLVWNSSSDTCIFLNNKTGEEYNLLPHELLVVGNYVENEFVSGSGFMGCTATCKGSFFACCNWGPPARCRCLSELNTNVSCDSGGLGTSSCSIIATSNE